MTYVQKLIHDGFQARRSDPQVLRNFDIELTERCDNACIHCYINLPEEDEKARAAEMDTAFVKDILQQAAALGTLDVRFTGGEPLLREDFAELYLFARRLGMRVTLFTNARRITPELAQLMGRVIPGKLVEVTVYGMHSESYDAVAARRGAFAEFRRGIDLLLEYKIPFVVKQAFLPPNRHEIEEFEAWAATLPGMHQKPGYSMNFDLRARRDHPARNRFIQSLRLSPEETVAMLNRNPGYIAEMRQFCAKFMGPPGDRLFSCGAGKGLTVDAYGRAQMCLQLRHPEVVYDLRSAGETINGESPLRYVLTRVFPAWRERRAENPDYLRRCARCFLKGLCEQCPAKAWQEHGTLDTPVEYLCEVAHARARDLGLLYADEKAWQVEEWRERVARLAASGTAAEEKAAVERI